MKKILFTLILTAFLFNCETHEQNKYNENEIIFVVEMDSNEGKSEDDIAKASSNADAIIVLTEWDEYSKIKWDLIAKEMRKPAWVFDARSIVNEKEVIATDLNLWKVGNGSI